MRTPRFEMTPDEADAWSEGARRMRQAIAAKLNAAGLHAAAAQALAVALPDPRPAPTGLEYRGR
jgi:hypothetical protein